jgi:predicted membrane protein
MAKHVVADDKIRMTSFFGGSENQIASKQFRGGRVYAVFGSNDIDLRGATLADEGARITAINIFGGIKLLVPEDWVVNVQTRAVFGGVTSKRGVPASPVGQLTLSGLSLFGGVEIKS